MLDGKQMNSNYKETPFSYNTTNSGIFNFICKFLTLFIIAGFFSFSEVQVLFLPLETAYFLFMTLYFYKNSEKFNLYAVWGLFFILICAMTYLWAYNRSVIIGETIRVFQMILVGYFLIIYAKDQKDLNTLLVGCIIGGVVLAARLFINTPADEWGTSRIGYAIGYNPNAVAYKMSICFLIALHLVKKNRKIVYLLCSAVFMVISFMTGSRKAMIFIVLGLFLFLFFSVKKKRNLIIVLPILFLLVYAIYFLVMNVQSFYDVLGVRFERLLYTIFTGDVGEDTSTKARFEFIDKGIELIKQSPLLGYGLGNYAYISGYGVYSHNNYIEMATSVGLIGAAVYYIMYIGLLIKLLIKWVNGNTDSAVFIALICCFLVMDYGLVSYSSKVYQIILAICYAFCSITEEKNKILSFK